MKAVPCIKYPTTVVCIDDDRSFLNNLGLSLEIAHIPHKVFDKHQLALPYINAENYRCNFMKRLKEVDDDLFDISPVIFLNEMMDPERYTQISVLVIDYDMPGMNGLELCEAIQNPYIKIILLTGAADDHLAVKAFNKGLIYQYIQKQDPHFVDHLIETIIKAQQEYFQEISTLPLEILMTRPEPTALVDTPFKIFFDDLIKKHSIEEYYLVEEIGSFLMIDHLQNVHSLITLTDDLVESYLDSDSADSLTSSQIESLKQRKLIPCHYDPFNKPNFNMDHLADSLHPPTVIQGKNQPYYSVFGRKFIPIDYKDIAFQPS